MLVEYGRIKKKNTWARDTRLESQLLLLVPFLLLVPVLVVLVVPLVVLAGGWQLVWC
jgi:hypothetical protein